VSESALLPPLFPSTGSEPEPAAPRRPRTAPARGRDRDRDPAPTPRRGKAANSRWRLESATGERELALAQGTGTGTVAAAVRTAWEREGEEGWWDPPVGAWHSGSAGRTARGRTMRCRCPYGLFRGRDK
jgi:hypothetical protein